MQARKVQECDGGQTTHRICEEFFIKQKADFRIGYTDQNAGRAIMFPTSLFNGIRITDIQIRTEGGDSPSRISIRAQANGGHDILPKVYTRDKVGEMSGPLSR